MGMFSKLDIEKYFNAEKQLGFWGLIIAAALIAGAILFIVLGKTNLYKGVAVPLFAVSLLLGIACFTIYNKSDRDRKRNVYAFDMNPSELKDKELPRMKKVMSQFAAVQWVEILLILVGIGLFVYFKNNGDQTFCKGFGLSLAIMALLLLTIDFFAAKRGSSYTEGLTSFINSKFK